MPHRGHKYRRRHPKSVSSGVLSRAIWGDARSGRHPWVQPLERRILWSEVAPPPLQPLHVAATPWSGTENHVYWSGGNASAHYDLMQTSDGKHWTQVARVTGASKSFLVESLAPRTKYQ